MKRGHETSTVDFIIGSDSPDNKKQNNKMADNTLLDFQQKISATLEIAIKSVTEASESTDPVAKTIAPTLAALLAVVQLQQQCLNFFLQQNSTNRNSDQQMLNSLAKAPYEEDYYRFRHERSVVVSNLEESKASTASQRLKADEEKVQNLLDVADIEVRPLSVFRMGKPSPNRPRLLKVEFPSKSVVRKLMSNKNSLRNNSTYSKVFVRPSQSRPEREARKILIQDRIKKNAELLPDDRNNDPYILYGPPNNLLVIRKSEISKFRTTHH